MKLALRTAAVPRWDFLSAATAAVDYGYDGVELHASSDAADGTATNVLLTDPQKIRTIFSDAGIQIASIGFTLQKSAGELSRVIETAAGLGAITVRILRGDAATELRGFESFAARVLPFADTAAAAGITLLLENEPATGSVSRLWRAVDGFNHPSIACCWSPGNGRAAKELPLVSIPTLNSRIRLVRFEDVNSAEIPTQKILQRLGGIGFGGWLLVDNSVEENCRESQRMLRTMLTQLRPPLAASRTNTH